MAKKDTHDVDLLTLDNSLQGPTIVHHLQTKGFCKIKAGVDIGDCEEAIKESAQLETQSRFHHPSVLLHEALLGVQGSFRIAKLHRIDEEEKDGEHLQKLDELLTDVAMIIQPHFEELGFSCSGRTVGMLHDGNTNPNAQAATVEAYGKETKMTEEQASRWLVDLVRGKILCVVCMGPSAGSMTFATFSDADESIEVPTEPGDVFLIRQDALVHRHASKAKCMLMSCFFMSERMLSHKSTFSKGLEASLSPATKALVSWAEKRMMEAKTKEVMDEDELAELPKEWTRAMNATYSTGQRIAVNSLATRIPTSWDVNQFHTVGLVGCDMAEEVPLQRWDHYGRFYDADSAQPWKQMKSSCRHAAFVEGLDLFSPKDFSLSPAESGGMDPIQRWTLEVGYEAAKKAGFARKQLMNSFGGVYAAVETYAEWNVAEKSCDMGATGGASSIVCGRLSFIFGIKGPCVSMSMEECGSHLITYMAAQCVSERGRYIVPPYALFGGGSCMYSPLTWLPMEASGHFTKIGRSRSYDNYADGFMRGDGLGFGIMKRHVEVVDGQAIIKADSVNNMGVFAGGFMNHAGTSSTYGTPSGSALSEVLYSAVRAAVIEPSDVDAAECHGNGHFFTDAIEGRVYQRVFRANDEDIQDPLILSASKSSMGNSIDAAGMTALTRLLYTMKAGNSCPNLHLLELNPNMEAVDCPAMPATEAMSFKTRVTYQSLLGVNYCGMQVGLIWQGQLDGEQNEAGETKDAITFWPAGGGVLDADLKPRRGYYVCGTMTKWEPTVMKERGKEHSYTFTLGENRWEDFQIWVDGDSKKVLIPGKASGVEGPADGGDSPSSLGAWRIDGNPNYVFDITEDGEETVREVETPDTGLIGQQYKIVVKVAGRFLQVTWEKLPLDDKALAAIVDAPVKGSPAEYFLAGSWNRWLLSPMERDKKEPGLFHSKCFAHGRHSFVIVRNRDWSQVMYPSYNSQDDVYGPDEDTGGSAWFIDSAPRDGGLAITFQRTTEAGLDVKKVSWRTMREAEAALQDQ